MSDRQAIDRLTEELEKFSKLSEADAAGESPASTEQPEPIQLQPATIREAREWTDIQARGDGQDDAPVPGHEADVFAKVVPPFEVVEVPAPEPVALAGDDGREPVAEIHTGPGMSEGTADAIREQQRLAHDSRREHVAHEAQRTEFTMQGVALAQRYLEEAVAPALSGQFLGERIAEKRRVESGVYPLTERSSETGRPAELPDARLQAVRNSLVSLNEGSRGITPPVRIAEAQRLINEELRQQQEYRRGRAMLLDAERQARQQIQVALKEAKPTFFGKEGRLVRRMKGLRASLRNLGNYDEICQEISDLKKLRNHKLAKNGKAVDAEIVLLEGRQRAHESIDGFLAQKDLDPYLRVAVESRLKGQLVDYGDLSNPANVLYQKVYEGTVDFLLGSARTNGEVPSPAAAIPDPERAGGLVPSAEEEDESSMDDPVSRLRLIAERKTETRTSQEGHRQAIRAGNDDATQTARHLIEIVERGDNHDEAIRMAQQLVADLLDDMKTMTSDERVNTMRWFTQFTGELMGSERGWDFRVNLMSEAIGYAFQILSASGR